jgi:lambda family phage portal protein
VANVVGTGIALEPDTGDDVINARIRVVWQEFIADCTVNGEHDVYYLQAQALRETVLAGEFIWRLVVIPERVDAGKLPICVLPLEAEWLDDQSNTIGNPDADGVTWVGGVGVDAYGCPVAYRLRNPEAHSSSPEMVSAKEILHDFERRRSLQARGEPWFAPVIETLQQERDLVDAELKAAVNTASIAMVITSEAHDTLDTTEEGDSEDPAQSLRLGGVSRMYPGEKVEAFGHTRPAQQIAPFRQMLRGDIAGALRLPQRFLDRDVGRANYSSMRCDMLDNEKLLAPVREWFGQATIGRLYKAALPYLALKAGIKTPRANYKLLPDGQPYVDPYKDIQGAAMAIAAGVSTHQTEISKRGGDYLKVWEQAKKEKEQLRKLGLTFDLSGTNAPAPESQLGSTPDETQKKGQTNE